MEDLQTKDAGDDDFFEERECVSLSLFYFFSPSEFSPPCKAR